MNGTIYKYLPKLGTYSIALPVKHGIWGLYEQIPDWAANGNPKGWLDVGATEKLINTDWPTARAKAMSTGTWFESPEIAMVAAVNAMRDKGTTQIATSHTTKTNPELVDNSE